MGRALQRVEELEIQGDFASKKISELESEREEALSQAQKSSKDAEASSERAEKAEKELEAALERMQELEAKIGPLEARAEGLSSLLTGIGRSVGAALKDTEVADGDLSLFDATLDDKERLEESKEKLELDLGETQAQVGNLSKKLTFAEGKAKLLVAAEARIKKLTQGLAQITEKSGANGRSGFLGAIFGRSEEQMIQDTLDQLDDLKKSRR